MKEDKFQDDINGVILSVGGGLGGILVVSEVQCDLYG